MVRKSHAEGTPMNLTAREKDKLLIAMAALVARRRLERGVKLNFPEAVALISDFVVEGARDGRSVAELMAAGGEVLRRGQVMEGVAEMLHDVHVEATLPDGPRLVTVHNPIRGRWSPWLFNPRYGSGRLDPRRDHYRRRRYRAERWARGRRDSRRQSGRSPDPSRLALPFRRNQSGPRLRSLCS